MSRRLLILTFLAGFATRASAQVTDQAAVPYMMRYGVCSYAHPADAAACDAVRRRVSAEALPVLDRFYLQTRTQVRRRFFAYFSVIDRQSAELADQRKWVSPAVIDYMRCLADAMISQSSFQSGALLDGDRAARQCSVFSKPIFDGRTNSSTERRARLFTRRLGSMGQARRFVAIDSRAREDSSTFSDGLLDLSVPAD